MILKNANGRQIADALIHAIQSNKEYLSEIDGLIGDGDHGINMNKGFTMCQNKLEGQTPTVSDALMLISETLLEDIGGSMGPLYGVLFEGMSDACAGKEDITAEVFGDMLTGALEGLQDISPAKKGDKTLMDTLMPAQEGYAASLAAGKSFAECLDDMKAAAEAGWQSTKDLVAKIGRASRLGERSRGVLDAGSTSCYLLLSALADSTKALLED